MWENKGKENAEDKYVLRERSLLRNEGNKRLDLRRGCRRIFREGEIRVGMGVSESYYLRM